jgi:hypothetical protein
LDKTKTFEAISPWLHHGVRVLELFSPQVDLIILLGGIVLLLHRQEEVGEAIAIKVDHGHRVWSCELWCLDLALGTATAGVDHGLPKVTHIILACLRVVQGHVELAQLWICVMIVENYVIYFIAVNITNEGLGALGHLKADFDLLKDQGFDCG